MSLTEHTKLHSRIRIFPRSSKHNSPPPPAPSECIASVDMDAPAHYPTAVTRPPTHTGCFVVQVQDDVSAQVVTGTGGVMGYVQKQLDQDLHAHAKDSEYVSAIHDNAEKFDPRAEDVFKYVQVSFGEFRRVSATNDGFRKCGDSRHDIQGWSRWIWGYMLCSGCDMS